MLADNRLVCPCCKQTVPQREDAVLPLPVEMMVRGKNEQTILQALAESAVPVQAHDLVRKVYGYFPPADPDNTIRVIVCHMRPKLKKHGITIKARADGHSGYRLERVKNA